jgi:hypothetical protein
VLVRSHAERIVVLLGDEVVADHPRQFRRDQIIYDPWHYLEGGLANKRCSLVGPLDAPLHRLFKNRQRL